MVDSLKIFSVSIPSEFTLLSNTVVEVSAVTLFQYPLNLHCSQTNRRLRFYEQAFQYPLNLHCSQTWRMPLYSIFSFNTLWIYTALKLHTRPPVLTGVSIPSEFTLLSNRFFLICTPPTFQYPLNLHCSQTKLSPILTTKSFNTLWIYTALKLKIH